MSLPGGASNKIGNRYETCWTVYRLLDLLTGKASQIRLEPPGPDGEGVEFWIEGSRTREYHQVKRQDASEGHWTIASLKQRGVLKHAVKQLRGSRSEFWFVSTEAVKLLSVLTERARSAESSDEFRNLFLTTEELRSAFDLMKQHWNDESLEVLFDYLQRFHLETRSEESLSRELESRVEPLVAGPPALVVDALSTLVADSIHQTLTPSDLWTFLNERGLRPRNWAENASVIQSVHDATERFSRTIQRKLILESTIPRPESGEVVEALTSDDFPPVVFVTGTAGVGKSSVLGETLRMIEGQGWPVLAFSVGPLNPTQLPVNVGEQLGLAGSPVGVLGAIAQDRPCLLLIDQLDSFSSASGRSPEFLDCIEEIVSQAKYHPNMRVLLACRQFDLKNDRRLRELQKLNGTITVAVDLLPEEDVHDVLDRMGVDATSIQSHQMELLRTPIYLSLLSDIVNSGTADPTDFADSIDLYDAYVKAKMPLLRDRLDREPNWDKVSDLVIDRMNLDRRLWIPVDALDGFNRNVDAMLSEHLLVSDGHRIAFFHETFADYMFARRFFGRGLKVSNWILSDEQHLFTRSQIRQLLTYERQRDRRKYAESLRFLAHDPRVRLHIKQVVFVWLASLLDPGEDEWEIIQPLIVSPSDPFGWGIVKAFYDAKAWFRLLDFLGEINAWLNSGDDSVIGSACDFMARSGKHEPQRVAILIVPFIGASAQWNHRVRHVITRGEIGESRELFEILLLLIDEGLFDPVAAKQNWNADFFALLYNLRQNPEWACEALLRYLRHCFDASVHAGQPNPFEWQEAGLRDRNRDYRLIVDIARAAPVTYLSEMVQLILQTALQNLGNERESGRTDRVWPRADVELEEWLDFEDALVAATAEAARWAAINTPEYFDAIVEQLGSSNLEIANYLLLRAFIANPVRYTGPCVQLVYDRPGILGIGYGGSSNWLGRKLLGVLYPVCDDSDKSRLDVAVMGFYPPSERSKYRGQSFGYAQYVLTGEIDTEDCTTTLRQRILELRRKFPNVAPRPPARIELQTARSPIPKHAYPNMTDEQWLGAMTKYAKTGSYFSKDDRFIGGDHELSHHLADAARAEPERFAALVQKIPQDSSTAFFTAILSGVESSSATIDVVASVVEQCHELPGRPCGSAIVRTIRSRASDDMPRGLLDAVAWYATEDPDPADDSVQQDWDNEAIESIDRLVNAGLNTTRGGAADAMAALVFAETPRAASFIPSIAKMVHDPSLAVRSQVAEVLIALLNFDRDVAIDLFKILCDTEDVLLGSRYVESFLYWSLRTHFDTLRPIVERMISSAIPSVRKAGARQACVAALDISAASDLAQLSVRGDTPMRIAAAQVAAANVKTARLRSACIATLILLFNDDEPAVRKKACDCFYQMKDGDLASFRRLLSGFVSSPAISDGYDQVLSALDDTTASFPDLTISICEHFLQDTGDASGDIRTAAAAQADSITRLSVRAYSQSTHDDTTKRCLDVIDRLVSIGAYQVEKALESVER